MPFCLPVPSQDTNKTDDALTWCKLTLRVTTTSLVTWKLIAAVLGQDEMAAWIDLLVTTVVLEFMWVIRLYTDQRCTDGSHEVSC